MTRVVSSFLFSFTCSCKYSKYAELCNFNLFESMMYLLLNNTLPSSSNKCVYISYQGCLYAKTFEITSQLWKRLLKNPIIENRTKTDRKKIREAKRSIRSSVMKEFIVPPLYRKVTHFQCKLKVIMLTHHLPARQTVIVTI